MYVIPPIRSTECVDTLPVIVGHHGGGNGGDAAAGSREREIPSSNRCQHFLKTSPPIYGK